MVENSGVGHATIIKGGAAVQRSAEGLTVKSAEGEMVWLRMRSVTRSFKVYEPGVKLASGINFSTSTSEVESSTSLASSASSL